MAFAVRDLRLRWPGGVVPYTLDDQEFPTGTAARAGFDRVVAYLAATAGVELVRRTAATAPAAHVVVRRSASRPSSEVGRSGDAQALECAIADLTVSIRAVTTFADTSPDSPALAYEGPDPAGDAGYLLAWRGEGEGRLNLGRLGRLPAVEAKVVTALVCDHPPGLGVLRRPAFGAPDSVSAVVALVHDDDLVIAQTPYQLVADPLGTPTPLVVRRTGPAVGDPATGVAVAVHAGRVHVAWGGDDERLVVARLEPTEPGTADLRVLARLDETTASPPALASHQGILHLAWRGLDGHINVMVDARADGGFAGKATSAHRTTHGVALTAHRDPTTGMAELYAAWRQEDERVSVARLGPAGFVDALWQRGVAGQLTTSTAPALAGGPDAPALAWVGAGNPHLNWAPFRRLDDGALVHEVGHALGLLHEQQRPDRAAFVTYVGPTEGEEYDRNYRIRADEGVEIGPYDLSSRMHYPVRAGWLQAGAGAAPTPSGGLSPGDLTALRRLYPIKSVRILSETSGDAPSLSTLPDGSAGVVAWRGAGNDHLNVGLFALERVARPAGTLLAAGGGAPSAPWPATPPTPPAVLPGGDLRLGSPAPVVTTTATSDAGPAVVGTRLFWRGSGNSNLTMGEVGETGLEWARILPERSEHSPGACRLGSDYLLAWSGDGNDELNLAVLSPDGRLLGKLITREHTGAAPAVASSPYDGRAYVAWQGSGNDHLNVALVQWSPGPPATLTGLGATTTLPETSDGGPALACVADRVVLGWKGSGNEHLNLAVSGDQGRSFAATHVSGETTARAPALAVADLGRGRAVHTALLVAWRGAGNEQLNLGVADLDWT